MQPTNHWILLWREEAEDKYYLILTTLVIMRGTDVQLVMLMLLCLCHKYFPREFSQNQNIFEV